MTAYRLPKLFCPIKPALHPHMEEIESEALERWAKYLGMHARHPVFHKLRRSHFPMLLGRCHPSADPARLRSALDFLIWNFSWDDQVDVGDVPAEWVRQQSETALGVLHGELPFHDSPPLLWLLVGIRDQLAEQMPPQWLERFIHACDCYFQGTIWEAQVRASRTCLDVERYIELRRLSVGTYMVFTQVEAVEGFMLPLSVLAHPVIAQMVETATDIIAWANDLFSLGQDLQDEAHPNLVFSLQKERGLSLQEAVDVAVEMHDEAMRRFLDQEQHLPSFGELDGHVANFVLGLRRWIRANVDWSIQTGRYQEKGEQEEARVA